MKRIDSARVVADADRAHELQRERRDLIKRVREINAELAPLQQKLMKVNEGQDFIFLSADEYLKAVEVHLDDETDRPDVEAMKVVFLRLKRKVPLLKQTSVVVRYLTDDELE